MSNCKIHYSLLINSLFFILFKYTIRNKEEVLINIVLKKKLNLHTYKHTIGLATSYLGQKIKG